jgi:hypothetical protein
VLESMEEVKAGDVAKVISSGSKWRPQCQAVKYSLLNFEYCGKSLQDNILRFNPVQIAEWLADLLAQGEAKSQAELEDRLGIDRTRIGQFLRLMRLPEETRLKLRNVLDLNEHQIRGMITRINRVTCRPPELATATM